MNGIGERLIEVKNRIAAAAVRADRDPKTIRLVAVSKRQPAEAIRAAYQLGQRDFGENYVQELERKAAELADLPALRLHLIGHLQRNKVKVVVPLASVIHTVDSIELATEIAKRAAQREVPEPKQFPTEGRSAAHCLPLLVEVNVGGEQQKSGCEPSELPALLDAIDALDHVQLVGLMTVPPFTDEAEQSQPYFEQLVALRAANGGAPRLPELSMGMTLDLEYAIQAGATIVRVGTAIFGERMAREGSH
jgi:pyridoxal phosphate enzyme (YggS family)